MNDDTPAQTAGSAIETQQAEYDAGQQAGRSNSGVWGGESKSWLEGYSDGRADDEEGEYDLRSARFGRPPNAE